LSASIIQGTAATIDTRSSITLIANASGGPVPYTYQWFQDGSAIAGQILPQINVRWPFAGTHTLYCIVNDSMQTTSTTAPLTLTVVPTASTPTPLPTQTPTTILYIIIAILVIAAISFAAFAMKKKNPKR
jgi:hypothetical protein